MGDRPSILHLLRQMLKFVPAERVTAEQVLKSEWMVKWELPVFQSSCLEELIVVWPKNNGRATKRTGFEQFRHNYILTLCQKPH